MKVFLQNGENKAQLFDMLLKVWGSDDAVEKLEGHQVILMVNGVAHQLQADGNKCKMSEIHTLRSNQEETDTRKILYLQHAEQEGYQSAVVRSPDSDIFFILLYYAHQLQIIEFFDTGTGKHRRLLNITETAQHLGKQYTMPYLVYTASLEKIVLVPSKGKVNLALYGSCKNTLDSKKCLLSLVQNGNWTQKYKLT